MDCQSTRATCVVNLCTANGCVHICEFVGDNVVVVECMTFGQGPLSNGAIDNMHKTL